MQITTSLGIHVYPVRIKLFYSNAVSQFLLRVICQIQIDNLLQSINGSPPEKQYQACMRSHVPNKPREKGGGDHQVIKAIPPQNAIIYPHPNATYPTPKHH